MQVFVYSIIYRSKGFRFEFRSLSFLHRIILVNAVICLFSPLPPQSFSPFPFLTASKSPARKLVSQSALSVFDDSKCTDIEFCGNRTRVRDVTLAVVTISILRFEPLRIARWLRTGPWRKRHADTNENECRERSEYNANCIEESITRNTARVGIFTLYAAKLRYMPQNVAWMISR